MYADESAPYPFPRPFCRALVGCRNHQRVRGKRWYGTATPPFEESIVRTHVNRQHYVLTYTYVYTFSRVRRTYMYIPILESESRVRTLGKSPDFRVRIPVTPHHDLISVIL